MKKLQFKDACTKAMPQIFKGQRLPRRQSKLSKTTGVVLNTFRYGLAKS